MLLSRYNNFLGCRDMQVTVNIQDGIESELNKIQNRTGNIFSLEKAFNLFLLQLKNTGQINNLDKAYDALLNAKPTNYNYSSEDLAGIDEGIIQAEKGEYISGEEMSDFFDGWKEKFKSV